MPEKIQLPECVILLLGTMSDRALAKQSDIGRSTIARERDRRGILAFKAPQIKKPSHKHNKSNSSDTSSKINRHIWKDSEIELLGTASDGDVALVIGCARHQVRYARQARGIPVWKKTKWGQSAMQTLAKKDYPKWFDGDYSRLGKKSDTEVGKDYGVERHAICRLRLSKGIPSFTFSKRWRDDEVQLLGKFSDPEVARMTGRTRSSVKFERMNRRIPGFKLHRGGSDKPVKGS